MKVRHSQKYVDITRAKGKTAFRAFPTVWVRFEIFTLGDGYGARVWEFPVFGTFFEKVHQRPHMSTVWVRFEIFTLGDGYGAEGWKSRTVFSRRLTQGLKSPGLQRPDFGRPPFLVSARGRYISDPTCPTWRLLGLAGTRDQARVNYTLTPSETGPKL